MFQQLYWFLGKMCEASQSTAWQTVLFWIPDTGARSSRVKEKAHWARGWRTEEPPGDKEAVRYLPTNKPGPSGRPKGSTLQGVAEASLGKATPSLGCEWPHATQRQFNLLEVKDKLTGHSAQACPPATPEAQTRSSQRLQGLQTRTTKTQLSESQTWLGCEILNPCDRELAAARQVPVPSHARRCPTSGRAGHL